jgi:hypothetical protein
MAGFLIIGFSSAGTSFQLSWSAHWVTITPPSACGFSSIYSFPVILYFEGLYFSYSFSDCLVAFEEGRKLINWLR